eukprot:Ihof_evm1s76 gene=Ihof_evmTU1s76
MANLNINSNVSDAFYRYKMPRLQAKVEGKGNGIKTVLVNMEDVARALNRPPTYPCKFFGCELGAQTQMDVKNSRFIVNGSHNASDLQELLDKFIKKYVLCPECQNPETDIRVSSQGLIKAKCVACGWRGEMDSNHRLATFIMRNPPTNEHSINKSEKKKEKKEKAEKEGDEGEKRVKKSKDKKEKEVKETSPTASKKEHKSRRREVEDEEAEDDEGDWSMDVSEAAVRARREALEEDMGDAVKGMTLTEADYMDMTEKDRLEGFKAFAMKAHTDKELLDEAIRLGIRDKAMAVIAELKFNESVLSQLKQNKILLQRFCVDDHETQRCLLGAIERLCTVLFPSLLVKVAHIIKALYDLDIVEEEVLTSWGDQSTSTYVTADSFKKILLKAEPVLAWLKEAESEDDDDDEVSFGGKDGGKQATMPSVPQTAAHG